MSSESSAGDYGNILVTPGELASVLGLTESRISALKRRGVIQAARPRKKERANRQLREILMEQTRDQLHEAQAVQFLVQDGNSQIRSQLLAFGDRLALQLAGKDPAEIKALIDHQIRKVLNELRQYDPRGYYRWQSKIALSSTGPRDAEPQLGEGSGEKRTTRSRAAWMAKG